MSVVIHTAFDPPPKVYVECDPAEGKTRQDDAAACDINNIVGQYVRTGMLPQVQEQGLFLDVSGVGDYQEALERVRAADTYFMSLPAKVRAEFDNDPAKFLDFAARAENRDDLVKMGIVEPLPAKDVVSDSASPAVSPGV